MDADLPLAYVFGSAPITGSGVVSSAGMQPFGGPRANAVYEGVLLPQGAAAPDYQVLLNIKVSLDKTQAHATVLSNHLFVTWPS